MPTRFASSVARELISESFGFSSFLWSLESITASQCWLKTCRTLCDQVRSLRKEHFHKPDQEKNIATIVKPLNEMPSINLFYGTKPITTKSAINRALAFRIKRIVEIVTNHLLTTWKIAIKIVLISTVKSEIF